MRPSETRKSVEREASALRKGSPVAGPILSALSPSAVDSLAGETVNSYGRSFEPAAVADLLRCIAEPICERVADIIQVFTTY